MAREVGEDPSLPRSTVARLRRRDLESKDLFYMSAMEIVLFLVTIFVRVLTFETYLLCLV